MNKDVKEKWVAALRSGEYKQGFGYLNKEGKLCCLGVLCEVLKYALKLSIGGYKDVITYNGQHKVLPTVIRNHLGLWEGELIAQNDLEGRSFQSIADYIERNL